MPAGRSDPIHIPGAQRSPPPPSADVRGSSLGPPPSLFYLPSRPKKAEQNEGPPECAVASASTSTAGHSHFIPIPAQRHPRYATTTTTSNAKASETRPGAFRYLPTGPPIFGIDIQGEKSSTFVADRPTPMTEYKYLTLEEIMAPAIASRSEGFDVDSLVDNYLQDGQSVTQSCETYVKEPSGMIEGSQKAIQQLKIIRRARPKDSEQRLSIDKQVTYLKQQIRAFEAVKRVRHGEAGDAIVYSMNTLAASKGKAPVRNDSSDLHLLNDPRYTDDTAPRWQNLLLPGVFDQEGHVRTKIGVEASPGHVKPSSFIPEWFQHLAQAHDIDITKQNDTEKLFRAFRQHINVLELAAGRRPGGNPYVENERWDKVWHEPSPDWSTQVRRERGGWWRCQSDDNKATAAEKACSFCHSETPASEGEHENVTASKTKAKEYSKEAAVAQLDRIEAAVKAAMAIVAKRDQEVIAERGLMQVNVSNRRM